MENQVVVMTLGDLAAYADHCKEQAQIEIVNDHIRPHSAAKARRLISQIKGKTTARRKKMSRKPRELKLKAFCQDSRHVDLSEITQYLVR